MCLVEGLILKNLNALLCVRAWGKLKTLNKASMYIHGQQHLDVKFSSKKIYRFDPIGEISTND